MNWDAKKRKAQINALPERIGAKQKRLPREAVFVSATTTGDHREPIPIPRLSAPIQI